jgi:RNA polymerase subunit RPABC4/transcription elongation factor Spt4
MTPETCPHCGADVPDRAAACPECGADAETGWNDRATVQRLGASDPDDFDAGEFAENEFGSESPGRRPWVWTATAIILLGSLLWMFLT